MTRFVVLEPNGMMRTFADLPDAEHIHLTRLPDGRWTAVAMMPHSPHVLPDGEWWADVPAEPEDGAR